MVVRAMLGAENVASPLEIHPLDVGNECITNRKTAVDAAKLKEFLIANGADRMAECHPGKNTNEKEQQS